MKNKTLLTKPEKKTKQTPPIPELYTNKNKKFLIKSKTFKEDSKNQTNIKISSIEDEEINSEDYISSTMLDVETNTYINNLTNHFNNNCDANNLLINSLSKLNKNDILTSIIQKNFNEKESNNDIIIKNIINNNYNFNINNPFNVGRTIENKKKNNIIISVNEENNSSKVVQNNKIDTHSLENSNNNKNRLSKKILERKVDKNIQNDKIQCDKINSNKKLNRKMKIFQPQEEQILKPKKPKDIKEITSNNNYKEKFLKNGYIKNEKGIIILETNKTNNYNQNNKLNNNSNNQSNNSSKLHYNNCRENNKYISPLKFKYNKKKINNTTPPNPNIIKKNNTITSNANSREINKDNNSRIDFKEFNNLKLKSKLLKNNKPTIQKNSSLNKAVFNEEIKNFLEKEEYSRENSTKQRIKISPYRHIKQLKSFNSCYTNTNHSFNNIQKICGFMNNLNTVLNSSGPLNNKKFYNINLKSNKRILNNNNRNKLISNNYISRSKNLSIGLILDNSKKNMLRNQVNNQVSTNKNQNTINKQINRYKTSTEENKKKFNKLNNKSINNSENIYINDALSRNEIKINITNNNINNITSNNTTNSNQNMSIKNLKNIKQSINNSSLKNEYSNEDNTVLIQENVVVLSVIDQEKNNNNLSYKNNLNIKYPPKKQKYNQCTFLKIKKQKENKKEINSRKYLNTNEVINKKYMAEDENGQKMIMRNSYKNNINNKIVMDTTERNYFNRKISPQTNSSAQEKTISKAKMERTRNLATSDLLGNKNTLLFKKKNTEGKKTQKKIVV